MKLKSLIVLLSLLSIRAFGLGPCAFLWNANVPFFTVYFGSVTIEHSDGSSYSVTAANVNSTNQYSFSQGDMVVVLTSGHCEYNLWGWSTFCSCDTHGNLTCGSPQQLVVDAVKMKTYLVVSNCNCPYGGSSASLRLVDATYCQAGGGGGQ